MLIYKNKIGQDRARVVGQRGFIPLMISIFLVMLALVMLAYLRVSHANK